jgi:ATP-dependent DNA helicase RecG
LSASIATGSLSKALAGFPRGITIDNILNRQSPRNRLVASILALCGLVERSGQGMNLMYELSIREAKPLPNFSGTDAYFVSLTLNGVILDKRMLTLMNRIGNERMESLSTDGLLIIDALFHERKLPDNILTNMKQLVDMGIVEHTGRGKYVLARSFYEVTGKSGVHTRLVGLDRETNKELILRHIKNSGSKGAPLKELQQVLPSHSRRQVQLLLTELRNDGKIDLTGKTGGAKWFLI